MRRLTERFVGAWSQLGPRFLPFADAATIDVPLSRLLRLSLFQVSVGMAVALLTGTLNRVMIVELGASAWLVGLMVALPLVFAPFRVLIGFRSDTHRSFLGWRRSPFIWMGSLLQFGGLAIMPFALLVLSGDTHAPAMVGHAGAALAFLLVGAGLHTTQTAGLALATDLVPVDRRPRVVALLYVMFLLGMVASSLIFGALLANYTPIALIQVIQAAAVATMVLNTAALWKQEVRDPQRTRHDRPRPRLREAWRTMSQGTRSGRLLIAVGLGTAGFSMQDILLEPYGGQILGFSVGATTLLTALLASGALVGFCLAARWLGRGLDPYRLSAAGVLIGIVAFSAVIFAAPLSSGLLFRAGTLVIGLGGGLFAVGTMTAAMDLAASGHSGMALGAWGAVQATAAGASIAVAGALRDAISALGSAGMLGEALAGPGVGYSVVYHIEIALLFATLAVIGPLAGQARHRRTPMPAKFGLAELPG